LPCSRLRQPAPSSSATGSWLPWSLPRHRWTFAGLVVVAIAGNAVENVVGVQLAVRNRPDFAIAVIINSSLQVALALTPVILFASLFFATELTLVFPTLLAVSLLLAAIVTSVVVYDGESTWPEGVVLVGLYVVIASAFWWG
jgi:Ca2+:H+ antiporter